MRLNQPTDDWGPYNDSHRTILRYIKPTVIQPIPDVLDITDDADSKQYFLDDDEAHENQYGQTISAPSTGFSEIYWILRQNVFYLSPEHMESFARIYLILRQNILNLKPECTESFARINWIPRQNVLNQLPEHI